MSTRREWLGLTATAAAALAVHPGLLLGARRELITRVIPSSGERVPVVGLGSSATFAQNAGAPDVGGLRDVMRTMIEAGGTVFDTAPSYGNGASETASGRIARELGVTDRIFWATKVNVASMQGGGTANPDAARRQVATSFERLGKRTVDLIQIHNLGDVPTHLGLLKELKQEGRIRYIGLTTIDPRQHEELMGLLRREQIDFIGINYAVDDRGVETALLPLAQERGTAVMVYMPFGRQRLWSRIGDRPLPEWAREFGAGSWAQFMIKWVAAHPAVTVVTPATSQSRNMADNMGAALGELPDGAMRERMARLVDALPPAAVSGPMGQPGPQAPGIPLAPAILDRYVGEYQAESGFTLTLRREGGMLMAKPGTNPEAPLAARSETRFADPRGPVIELQLDTDGRVTGLTVEQGGQLMPLRRMP